MYSSCRLLLSDFVQRVSGHNNSVSPELVSQDALHYTSMASSRTDATDEWFVVGTNPLQNHVHILSHKTASGVTVALQLYPTKQKVAYPCCMDFHTLGKLVL